MRYYCKLLMSESLTEKRELILKDIDNRRPSLNRYLLVLPDREDENLEICHSRVLSQAAYRQKDWFVVGIAEGYQSALNMVSELTQLVYDSTGNVNIRAYILEQQRQFEEGNQ